MRGRRCGRCCRWRPGSSRRAPRHPLRRARPAPHAPRTAGTPSGRRNRPPPPRRAVACRPRSPELPAGSRAPPRPARPPRSTRRRNPCRVRARSATPRSAASTSAAGPYPVRGLMIWDCSGSASQHWTFPSDGTVRSPGLCGEFEGGSTVDGTDLRMAFCDGRPAQQFTLNVRRDVVSGLAEKCVEGGSFSRRTPACSNSGRATDKTTRNGPRPEPSLTARWTSGTPPIPGRRRGAAPTCVPGPVITLGDRPVTWDDAVRADDRALLQWPGTDGGTQMARFARKRTTGPARRGPATVPPGLARGSVPRGAVRDAAATLGGGLEKVVPGALRR